MLAILTTLCVIALIAVGIVTGLIGFIIANWFAVLAALAFVYVIRSKGKRSDREVN